MNRDLCGIVLAGGLSRRMGGGDKPLLELDGHPVIGHVIDRMVPQIGHLAINANGDPARFSPFGLPVFADTVEGFAGPLAGILAGMEWAVSHTDAPAIVTAAGDTPFFPRDLVERLSNAVNALPDAIAVAISNGRRHPTFALWPVMLRTALKPFLEAGNRRVVDFIDGNEHVDVDFPISRIDGIDPFFNINTPDDLVQAGQFARGLAP